MIKLLLILVIIGIWNVIVYVIARLELGDDPKLWGEIIRKGGEYISPAIFIAGNAILLLILLITGFIVL